jgi:5-methylthioribose kinase
MKMQWIDSTNAEAYLRDTGRIGSRQRVTIETLAGGVSNEVLYVGFPDGDADDFVLKQARPQLRTPEPWFCGVERIWREVEVLHACQEVLQRRSAGGAAPLAARTPRVLFEDRENYAFAMSAAARQHVVWKRQLLTGDTSAEIAAECGRLLAALHAGGWRDAHLAQRLGDRTIFDQLRLDPYYRAVASRDPAAAPVMQRLIDSVWQHPLTLVHADFSPKNLLVEPDGLMMVDFETGHFGDPAFDLGFFLSHLVLKAFFHAPRGEPLLELTSVFWNSYRSGLLATISPDDYTNLVARSIQNFAGCAWARIDGKSKVEYLLESPQREPIRQLCRSLLMEPVADWNEVVALVHRALG